MITFLAITGSVFWASIIIFIIWFNVEYVNDKYFLLFTFFGFGFMWCRDKKHIRAINMIRKTTGRRLFIEAPRWFNRYIYNFGVK